MNENKISRRIFFSRSFNRVLGFAFVGSGIETLLSACGKSNSAATLTPVTGGNCATNGTTITIQVVHTPNHTLTIPAADVIAGTQQTYTLADNGSGHTHTVVVTAADFAALQQNVGVVKASSAFGHTHSVAINCA